MTRERPSPRYCNAVGIVACASDPTTTVISGAPKRPRSSTSQPARSRTRWRAAARHVKCAIWQPVVRPMLVPSGKPSRSTSHDPTTSSDDRCRRAGDEEPGVLVPGRGQPVRGERRRQRPADHEPEVARTGHRRRRRGRRRAPGPRSTSIAGHAGPGQGTAEGGEECIPPRARRYRPLVQRLQEVGGDVGRPLEQRPVGRSPGRPRLRFGHRRPLTSPRRQQRPSCPTRSARARGSAHHARAWPPGRVAQIDPRHPRGVSSPAHSRTCEPARASRSRARRREEWPGRATSLDRGRVPPLMRGRSRHRLNKGNRLTRRLATLVAVALLCAAVLPQTIAAAGPTGKLSKQDRALIAEAKVNGKDTVTILVAAQPGANRTVASGLRASAPTIRYRDDTLDYIRADIAPRPVAAAAALRGVQALEVDSLIPLPDPRPDAQTNPTPQPAPGASTPRANSVHADQPTRARSPFTARTPPGTAAASRSACWTSGSPSTIRRWPTTTVRRAEDRRLGHVHAPDRRWRPDLGHDQRPVSGPTFASGGVTYTAPGAGVVPVRCLRRAHTRTSAARSGTT